MARLSTLAAFVSVLILSASQAGAQTPGMTEQTRDWGTAGRWHVSLVPTMSGPACLLMTGYGQKPVRGIRHVWGIRAGSRNLMLILNSNIDEDVSAPEITVAVDGKSLGTFTVTDRPPTRMSTAAAQVTDADARGRILGMIIRGAGLRLTNGSTAFEETIDRAAAVAFRECRDMSEPQTSVTRP